MHGRKFDWRAKEEQKGQGCELENYTKIPAKNDDHDDDGPHQAGCQA